jgi:hypothetical protein
MLIEFIILLSVVLFCVIYTYIYNIYILLVDGIVFCLRGGCFVLGIVLFCFVFVGCVLYFL